MERALAGATDMEGSMSNRRAAFGADPRAEQYAAAMREARSIVRSAGAEVVAFTDSEPAPEVIASWRFRYAVELAENVMRKCEHGGWSQVHTVFGCEPNRAYCHSCAHEHAAELGRAASGLPGRDCDFCGVHVARVLTVAFNVAAVVVCASVCAGCLYGASGA